eukprot:2907544-Pyramimonas_sp.AAC.1
MPLVLLGPGITLRVLLHHPPPPLAWRRPSPASTSSSASSFIHPVAKQGAARVVTLRVDVPTLVLRLQVARALAWPSACWRPRSRR